MAAAMAASLAAARVSARIWFAFCSDSAAASAAAWHEVGSRLGAIFARMVDEPSDSERRTAPAIATAVEAKSRAPFAALFALPPSPQMKANKEGHALPSWGELSWCDDGELADDEQEESSLELD
mmetsp:Transcript_124296/g.397924  ORF Transcript_124296/g.397924 Transcript_124296/m.397924 type:complete len:124 (-) Transcript_124296:63-434(-)